MTMLGWQRLAETLFQKCALMRLPLRDRLSSELHVLAADFGRPHPGGTVIDLPLRHGHLARLVAASRSNVCRAMHAIRDDGMVDVIGDRIVLLEPAPGPSGGASGH